MPKVYRIAIAAAVAGACAAKPAAPPPPLVPQTAGTIAIDGLIAPVRVVRDRWGIPHIYAQNTTDLFLAQGFVQAQDRLFQMDLWRRASLGRLAEVLGPNFAERDAMTRRMQYRGDLEAEWSSYGGQARVIAAAFVRGVNAWVALAHDYPPEEFRLAGWTPAFWSEADLLSRTDAFLENGSALDQVRRTRMSDVVANALRLVGPAPFFVSLAGPVASPARAQPLAGLAPSAVPSQPARAVVTADGAVLFEEGVRRLDVPPRRYAVHLHAPGWNVAGLTAPWLPGVVAGHNERVAWAPAAADSAPLTQYVSIDVNDEVTTRVDDVIRVKGRAQPMTFQREETSHGGVVVATDVERMRVFTIHWTGFNPGGAAELAATAIDGAATADALRDELKHWLSPARQFAFVAGEASGVQEAGLGCCTAPRGRTEPPPEQAAGTVTFVHPLAVTSAARQRFEVGPIANPGTSPVRARFNPRNWDASEVMVAPGQSAFAGGGHYADLAEAWSKGAMVPLRFGDAAVQKDAVETLTLIPARKPGT